MRNLELIIIRWKNTYPKKKLKLSQAFATLSHFPLAEKNLFTFLSLAYPAQTFKDAGKLVGKKGKEEHGNPGAKQLDAKG